MYLKCFAKSVTNGNYAEIASRGTDFSSLVYVLSDGIAELVLEFPVGILYNFGDTGGTNVANFYQ